MYRSNEKGDRARVHDLRDPHVQRVQFTSEILKNCGGVAELQSLPLGPIRDAVVVVRLPVPVMLLFDGVHGRNWLVVTCVCDGDGTLFVAMASGKTLASTQERHVRGLSLRICACSAQKSALPGTYYWALRAARLCRVTAAQPAQTRQLAVLSHCTPASYELVCTG